MKTEPNPIQIESGIPIPHNSKYPFDQIEVGQSFVVPVAVRSSLASIWGRYRPKKFKSRRILGTDTLRVWRVE